MADTDQMTRAELLDARKRVKEQLRILQTPSVGQPFAGFIYKNREDLVTELNEILDEIEYELGKTNAKGA